MSSDQVVTKIDLESYGFKKVASGKVREIYELDNDTLLFAATDRISAYDVILDNVSCVSPLLQRLKQTCLHKAVTKTFKTQANIVPFLFFLKKKNDPCLKTTPELPIPKAPQNIYKINPSKYQK